MIKILYQCDFQGGSWRQKQFHSIWRVWKNDGKDEPGRLDTEYLWVGETVHPFWGLRRNNPAGMPTLLRSEQVGTLADCLACIMDDGILQQAFMNTRVRPPSRHRSKRAVGVKNSRRLKTVLSAGVRMGRDFKDGIKIDRLTLIFFPDDNPEIHRFLSPGRLRPITKRDADFPPTHDFMSMLRDSPASGHAIWASTHVVVAPPLVGAAASNRVKKATNQVLLTSTEGLFRRTVQ